MRPALSLAHVAPDLLDQIDGAGDIGIDNADDFIEFLIQKAVTKPSAGIRQQGIHLPSLCRGVSFSTPSIVARSASRVVTPPHKSFEVLGGVAEFQAHRQRPAGRSRSARNKSQVHSQCQWMLRSRLRANGLNSVGSLKFFAPEKECETRGPNAAQLGWLNGVHDQLLRGGAGLNKQNLIRLAGTTAGIRRC